MRAPLVRTPQVRPDQGVHANPFSRAESSGRFSCRNPASTFLRRTYYVNRRSHGDLQGGEALFKLAGQHLTALRT